ncbi:MAG: DUF763 domain-containing protein [Candidatus Rokubacteria bacterium]|nr:DUF763 domain-containing protein [Candidatus Rokubacteria bacterium]
MREDQPASALVTRLSDPHWFQAFGCLLGFDWHSSGGGSRFPHATSFRDPATFSFAHGGKDGHPYPVDRRTYDATIGYLETAVRRARIGEPERLHALRRLQVATA